MHGEPQDELEAAKWRLKHGFPLASYHIDKLRFEEMRVGRLDPDTIRELKRQYPQLFDPDLRRAKERKGNGLPLSNEELGLPRAIKYKAPTRRHEQDRVQTGANGESSRDWFPILVLLLVILLMVGSFVFRTGGYRSGGRYYEAWGDDEPPSRR